MGSQLNLLHKTRKIERVLKRTKTKNLRDAQKKRSSHDVYGREEEAFLRLEESL